MEGSRAVLLQKAADLDKDNPQDNVALTQMNTDDLIIHLAKVQSVLCSQVSQLQQQDKVQNLMKVKALFDANVAAISAAPLVESFGFRHLATEADTLSVFVRPVDLLTNYYTHHPQPLTTIGSFSLQERASLLTEYLRSRASRSLGKKCLYEMRRKIACDRPRVGGRFVRQKDKEAGKNPAEGAAEGDKPPHLDLLRQYSVDQALLSPVTSFLDTRQSFSFSVSPRFQQSIQRFSTPSHANASPGFYGLPSPYSNIYSSTFGPAPYNNWSTPFFQSYSPRMAATLSAFPLGGPEFSLPSKPDLPPTANYVPNRHMASKSAPSFHSAAPPVVPPSVYAQPHMASYLPSHGAATSLAEDPLIAQVAQSRMAEYASCLQSSQPSMLSSSTASSRAATKDCTIARTDSGYIPIADSLENQAVFNDETLSDNDEECFLLDLGRKLQEPRPVALPHVQTISELTSSFSAYSSDLDAKRRSTRTLHNRLASRPDSELSDVSFNSALFADS